MTLELMAHLLDRITIQEKRCSATMKTWCDSPSYACPEVRSEFCFDPKAC